MTVTGKPVRGFLRRYIFRHARRAGLKTVLTLLLAALLVGALGQLTVLRSRYGEMMRNVQVEAVFNNGLSLNRAESLMILQEQKEAAILRALGWSKKLTIRRLTLEQALLCLAGLALAIIALFAVNGLGFLGVILVPILYVIAHFALCVGASVAISASILQKSPMRLLQAKE